MALNTVGAKPAAGTLITVLDVAVAAQHTAQALHLCGPVEVNPVVFASTDEAPETVSAAIPPCMVGPCIAAAWSWPCGPEECVEDCAKPARAS